MGDEATEGFFWGARTLACLTTVKLLRGGEQRPAPAVFFAMLVGRIDKVFGHDIAAHLQAGDKAVELAAHLRTSKATGCT